MQTAVQQRLASGVILPHASSLSTQIRRGLPSWGQAGKGQAPTLRGVDAPAAAMVSHQSTGITKPN